MQVGKSERNISQMTVQLKRELFQSSKNGASALMSNINF